MPTLYEDTTARDLRELLGEVHAGTTVLPDFQRDFVWDPRAICELINSVANKYPAGSLLRIRNSKKYFHWRAFEGANSPNGEPTFLVLDGQQRLTSLYQAFYGEGLHRFFIDVQKLIDGSDLEDALFYCRRDRRPATDLLPFDASPAAAAAALAAQAKLLIFPLGEFQGVIGGFNTWKARVAKARSHGDASTLMNLLDQIEEVGAAWVQPIHDYRFPVVTLSDDTPADAVCTIFETLNRTGVKLTAFELLTARFFAHELNLRTYWEDARAEHPILDDFAIDPYAILQAITLRANRPVTIKLKALMNLTSGQVKSGWKPVVSALAEALTFLGDECGVMAPKWLPYGSVLPAMAAALADRPLKDRANGGVRRAKLKRWFWCACLGQVYEAAAGRKAELDYEQLVAWFDGGAEPQSISGFRFDYALLEQITVRQRALYGTLMCMTLAGGARDFHSHQTMTAAIIRAKGVDDHHIFPLDFLGEKNRRNPDLKFDNILNRTLIDAETNRSIGADGPAQYLAKIETHQGSLLDPILESHGIDAQARAALQKNDFESFKAARRAYFKSRIAELTGYRDPERMIPN